MTDSPPRLRWGILGTGMIAKKFAADLPHSEYGELVATASRAQESADTFAAEFGGRGVAGYEVLLADPEIDAVYVALPNGLHHDVTIAALRAGRHVLCEKPMARNLAEAEAMFAVAAECDRVLIEGFMYRAGDGLISGLIESVRNGIIGDLRIMRSNFTFKREASPDDARYHPDQAGGSLMDVGCYCVNLARALAGSEPTEVKAMAHLHPSGVDDYASGLMKFRDDFLVTFTCGMTVQSDPGTFIAGTKGTIHTDAFWLGKNQYTVQRPGEEIGSVRPAQPQPPLYAREADEFANEVWTLLEAREIGDGHYPPWITKEDTLGNMRVLDELRRSAGVPVPE